MFLSILPAPKEWNSKLVAFVTSSLPEKNNEFSVFPPRVITGPSSGVSSKNVPKRTPNALASNHRPDAWRCHRCCGAGQCWDADQQPPRRVQWPNG